MKKLIQFKVLESHYAIDQDIVKQRYNKEELFSERASNAKKVKIKLDGKDIPLYKLPVLFSDNHREPRRNDGEAMLIKDDDGHMMLLVDSIEDIWEVERDDIKNLSPVFGERSCRIFPKVMTKDNQPVLILSPQGIRAYAAEDDGVYPTRTNQEYSEQKS